MRGWHGSETQGETKLMGLTPMAGDGRRRRRTWRSCSAMAALQRRRGAQNREGESGRGRDRRFPHLAANIVEVVLSSGKRSQQRSLVAGRARGNGYGGCALGLAGSGRLALLGFERGVVHGGFAFIGAGDPRGARWRAGSTVAAPSHAIRRKGTTSSPLLTRGAGASVAQGRLAGGSSCWAGPRAGRAKLRQA